MGLMDRDYYRDKKPREETLLERIKGNPLAVVGIVVFLLFLLSLFL